MSQKSMLRKRQSAIKTTPKPPPASPPGSDPSLGTGNPAVIKTLTSSVATAPPAKPTVAPPTPASVVAPPATQLATPATPPPTPVPILTPPTSIWERAQQESLTITHWFDPEPAADGGTVIVRFSGQRVMEGPRESGDQFIQDEEVTGIVAGCGPIAVTTKVYGVNPGEYTVSARVQSVKSVLRGAKNSTPAATEATDHDLVASLWQSWGASTKHAHPVKTSQFPLARAPGIIPLIWPVLVVTGIIVALIFQHIIVLRSPHASGSATFAISVEAILVGFVGAKIWFLVKHRAEHRWEGWCIQGFIAGGTFAAIALNLLAHQSIGGFFDTIAPSMMFGMAVGRLGCFFGGCCGGPLTAARWGIWSSDQRVGGRRVPTQLMESGFSLIVGLILFAVLLVHGEAGGAYFAAALASYVLARQRILKLRLEQHTASYDWLVTLLAGLVLVASIVGIIVR